jgi:G patch domain-containing protein 2
VDSKEARIIAYVDKTPFSEPHDVEYTYEYNSEFVLGDGTHQGLGFHSEPEGTPNGIGGSLKQMEDQELSSSEKEVDADEGINCKVGQMREEALNVVSPSKSNSGFLSIGGMKLYTRDISDDEGNEDDYRESLDEGNTEASEPGEVVGSSESDGSDDSSDSDSDIDAEIAKDYLEGIGGSDNILETKWLMKTALDVSDDDSSSSSCLNETVEKFSGIALQEASREYGMKKPKPRKSNSLASRNNWSSTIDDLMLVKDPRSGSAKKKHVAKFPRSWPMEDPKSKYSRNFPGKFCSNM